MTDLVPAPDMLGLPMEAWLLRVLMTLTLALHWSFIGGAVGGIVLVLAARGRGGPAAGAGAALARGLVPWIIFAISMGVTLGIAPLLFVQVLYGNLFYPSNILIAGWWLAIVPLVIAALYLLYYARGRAYAGRPVPRWATAAALACLLAVGATLVGNTLLTQDPAAWRHVREAGAAAALAGGAVYPLRLAMALAALVAAGGLFVAVLGGLGRVGDAAAGEEAMRRGTALAAIAEAAATIAGLALILTMAGEQRAEMEAEAWLLVAAVAAGIATALLALAAWRRPTTGRVVAAALACFVGLLVLAWVRDGLRQAIVAPSFRLADVPVHAQWGPFVVFLVFFLGAVAVIAWLVRLALGARPAGA
jgi:hypothetical protein